MSTSIDPGVHNPGKLKPVRESFSFEERRGFDFQHQIQIAPVDNFELNSKNRLGYARVSYCVFGSQHGDKPLIILHPALTGSSRAVLEYIPEVSKNGEMKKANQGDGWWSNIIGAGKALDTDRYSIVCFDHLGGHYGATTAQDLLRQNLGGQATLADGVRLITSFLKQQGISEVHAVVGGSMGGGQAMEWLFQDSIKVGAILDISGCTALNPRSREFFSLQADLLDYSRRSLNQVELPARFQSHVSDLLAFGSPPVNNLVIRLSGELDSLLKKYSDSQALAWCRKFGFLRFVTPEYFEGKHSRRCAQANGHADVNGAANLLMHQWLDSHAESFVRRFTSNGLQNLCSMIGKAPCRSAEEVAERTQITGTKLIGFCAEGDVLFPANEQSDFYDRTMKYDNLGRVSLLKIKDTLNGHDHFLTEGFVEHAQHLVKKI